MPSYDDAIAKFHTIIAAVNDGYDHPAEVETISADSYSEEFYADGSEILAERTDADDPASVVVRVRYDGEEGDQDDWDGGIIDLVDLNELTPQEARKVRAWARDYLACADQN